MKLIIRNECCIIYPKTVLKIHFLLGQMRGKKLYCKEFYFATEIAVFETAFRTVASTPDSEACKTFILSCLAVLILTAFTIVSAEICND